jgi:PPP family 3-phenylpropionic acid transporter
MTVPLYAIAMEYINGGLRLNLGVSRGLGSAAFAVSIALVGNGVAAYGIDAIPPAFCVLNLGLLCAAIFTAPPPARGAARDPGGSAAARGGYLRFFRENPLLTLVLVGLTLVSISNLMLDTFLIRILNRAGGGNREMAYFASLGAVCEIPVMFLYMKLARRFLHGRLLTAAVCVYAARVVLTFFFTDMPRLYLLSAILGPCFAVFTLSSILYVNQITQSQDKTKGQALLSIATNGVSSIAASVIGGFALDAGGVRTMLIGCLFFVSLGTVLIFAAQRSAEKGKGVRYG